MYDFCNINGTKKTDRLYPSAPFENKELEQRLKKVSDVNSLNNSINNIKEMITYFKDTNNKPKWKYVNHKALTSISKSFDTFVNFDGQQVLLRWVLQVSIR